MATSKKYYIKRINKLTNQCVYKKYKCIDGWCEDKSRCWAFTKQYAKKIAQREYDDIHPTHQHRFCFELELADNPKNC